MSKLAELRALAAADVQETGIDMNVAQSGGGGRLLPEGYAFGRMVEYVEVGMQPQEYNGKAKDPALEFFLGFALWGDGYQNEDGTPYIIRTFNTSLSRNEKSGAFLMFKALNWKGTAKSFGELIGETFLVKIKHVPKDKAQPQGPKVSRLDTKGFLPPLDPVTRAPYNIPEAPDAMYRMFLWNKPTKAGWDSLFVEGTFDDGKSKNKVQETCLSALDFQGSPLQQLLLASGVTTLPAAPAAAPAAPVLPAAPSVAPTPAPAPAAPVMAPPAAPQVAAPLAPPAPVAAPALPGAPVMPAALPGSPVLPA